MCATSHPLASLTAIETLKRGGNAVDAAIAAVAVLGVVEPHMTGIGGDCFALIARPGKKPVALSASGRAPAAATQAWYASQGMTAISPTTAHAVTVPGAVDGWAHAQQRSHGRLPLGRPAGAGDRARRGRLGRRAACRGRLGQRRAEAVAACRRAPASADRRPRAARRRSDAQPGAGAHAARHRDGGRDAFYTGEIAEDMVATLREAGGLHTLADFAAQRIDLGRADLGPLRRARHPRVAAEQPGHRRADHAEDAGADWARSAPIRSASSGSTC